MGNNQLGEIDEAIHGLGLVAGSPYIVVAAKPHLLIHDDPMQTKVVRTAFHPTIGEHCGHTVARFSKDPAARVEERPQWRVRIIVGIPHVTRVLRCRVGDEPVEATCSQLMDVKAPYDALRILVEACDELETHRPRRTPPRCVELAQCF